ncbi:hypothetical protein O1V64_00310 (plasmid) [Rouxiella badensis]|uniref:Uncharacterized protein n=1 Tax=Rouxiella badensis TaxID=1646377 RepID=A0A1X0WB07_9GAMM|nr:hypothetical protein [Rouxiella badensis]ORJ23931.1 hypothetical protein BS640_18685 [Rouxiella badensis]WAT03182.1 hypothetical protein O1V64_00405 [Rouxiella badensis]WAT03298.1 hypothetical protein O1V64_00310 [Rouxiella badensis]
MAKRKPHTARIKAWTTYGTFEVNGSSEFGIQQIFQTLPKKTREQLLIDLADLHEKVTQWEEEKLAVTKVQSVAA